MSPKGSSTLTAAARPSGHPVTVQCMSTQSFVEIYREHFDFVWRNTLRLGVPTASADDVVQEVFIVVQRRLAEFDGRASMRSWLFGILGHVVMGYRRGFKRKDARCVPLEQAPRDVFTTGAGSTPSDHAENAEQVRILEMLLDRLDEDKRTLLVLSELEEWTLREIAEHLGSNINTVYSQLRAAKRAFEKLYLSYVTRQGGVR